MCSSVGLIQNAVNQALYQEIFLSFDFTFINLSDGFKKRRTIDDVMNAAYPPPPTPLAQ